MGQQEIHVHFYLEPPRTKAEPRPRHRTKARPKATYSESEFRDLMTRNLWERHMFSSFTMGLNPWINLQSAKQADASGQSVEIMGCEMEEARIAGQTVEKFTHTIGSIVTADNIVDFMIKRGFKIAERYEIARELMELYLESRIELLGQAWTLTNYNIAQQKAKVYQRDLELAS